MAPSDPVLTIEQVAGLIKWSVRSIERALSAGTFPIRKLPSIHHGRQRSRRLWARGEVERWIERNGRKVAA